MSTELQLIPAQNILADAQVVAQGLPKLIAMLEQKMATLDVSNPAEIRSLLDFTKEKLKAANDKRAPFTRHLDETKKIFTVPEGELKTKYIDRLQALLDENAKKELEEQRKKDAEAAAKRTLEMQTANIAIKFAELMTIHLAKHKQGAVHNIAALSKEAMSAYDTTLRQEDWAAMAGNSLVAAMTFYGVPVENKAEVFEQCVKPWLEQNKATIFREYKESLDAQIVALMSAPEIDAAGLVANADKQLEIETQQAAQQAQDAQTEAVIEATLSGQEGSVQVVDANAVKVKVKKVVAPASPAEVLKMLAKFFADGKADMDWCEKNLKTVYTHINKLATQEEFLAGVTYKEEIKGK
jgi:hypothetical protein